MDSLAYYQCTSDGSTTEIPGGASVVGAEFEFQPDCPTLDDGGFVYVEIQFGGDAGQQGQYTIRLTVGE